MKIEQARVEAISKGLTHYFTGRPCRRGHIAPRTVSGWGCVECMADRSKQWKIDNPERYRANERSQRQKPEAKAKAAEYSRTYAQRPESKEKDREQKREAYKRNPDIFKSRAKAWTRDNPDKKRAIDRNRKARKRNAEGRHTAEQIADLFKHQRGRCAYCPTKLKPEYHVDHIIALANGGTNWISNIQLLCPPCNMSKQDRDPIEFMQSRGMLL